jgi:hypothetical protein
MKGHVSSSRHEGDSKRKPGLVVICSSKQCILQSKRNNAQRRDKENKEKLEESELITQQMFF